MLVHVSNLDWFSSIENSDDRMFVLGLARFHFIFTKCMMFSLHLV